MARLAWRLFAALPADEQRSFLAGLPLRELLEATPLWQRLGRWTMLTRVRTWLKGKKTYLTAAAGALGALDAWADGQLDGLALLAALWAAAQAAFLRAGIAKRSEAPT